MATEMNSQNSKLSSARSVDTMLGRNRFTLRVVQGIMQRASALRGVTVFITSVPSLQNPARRRVHISPNPRGFWNLVIGDAIERKVHKAIGKSLEEYDKTLLQCYTNATETVVQLCTTLTSVPPCLPLRCPSRFNRRLSSYRRPSKTYLSNGSVCYYERHA
jgi:hypothetical protein